MADLYVSNPKGKKRRKGSTKKRATKARRTTTRRANTSSAPRRAKARGTTTYRRRSSPAPRRRRANGAARRLATRRTTTAAAPARRQVYRAKTRRPNGAGKRRAGLRVRQMMVVRRRNGLELSNPTGGIFHAMMALVAPAIGGAIGVEAIGQTVRMVSESEFVQEYTPDMIKEYAPRVAYTLGGVILGSLLQLVPGIPTQYKQTLGLAMASAGAGVDWYRYRSESGAYGDLSLGDGGNWSVENPDESGELGALELGALELGALELGDYAGDEDFCGADFSPEEGDAIANGKMLHRFPHRHGQKSRGMEGHRWRWAAQRHGVEALRDVARLPPGERQEMIHAMKAEAREARGVSRDQPRIAQRSDLLNRAPQREREADGIPFDTGAGAAF